MNKPTTDDSHSDPRAGASRSSGAAAAIVIILVLLLPILYVLSIGPVIWLEARDYIEVNENSPIVLFYWPILWSAERFEFAQAMLDWYADLWDSS